jgi:hypothetical protein
MKLKASSKALGCEMSEAKGSVADAVAEASVVELSVCVSPILLEGIMYSHLRPHFRQREQVGCSAWYDTISDEAALSRTLTYTASLLSLPTALARLLSLCNRRGYRQRLHFVVGEVCSEYE